MAFQKSTNPLMGTKTQTSTTRPVAVYLNNLQILTMSDGKEVRHTIPDSCKSTVKVFAETRIGDALRSSALQRQAKDEPFEITLKVQVYAPDEEKKEIEFGTFV